VQHFGGEIIGAAALMHGKTSLVQHDGEKIYRGISNPFEVGRYHSLAANREKMPHDLIVTARTTDGEIMGVRHRTLSVEGVQFHPESVLTPEGPKLLENFVYR
jgi:anthranilate synthase/aminodeoxychorismate synthase-like glutamine amidotransferase